MGPLSFPVCGCRKTRVRTVNDQGCTMSDLVDPVQRAFLGVERSVSGQRWVSRLDQAGQNRALAISQVHGFSDLIARVLAGRGVTMDDAVAFLEPTIRSLMPDPDTLTDCSKAAARIVAAIRKRREGRDLRRLRRRRGRIVRLDVPLPAPFRRRSRNLHSRSHLRGLRPQSGGDQPVDRQWRAIDRHRRLRFDQPRIRWRAAEARGSMSS